jgi:GTP-binding protein EngB required for normal cell division
MASKRPQPRTSQRSTPSWWPSFLQTRQRMQIRKCSSLFYSHPSPDSAPTAAYIGNSGVGKSFLMHVLLKGRRAFVSKQGASGVTTGVDFTIMPSEWRGWNT